MKLRKTSKGYESKDSRFQFIVGECAASKNGCWRKAWHLLDNGKLVSDRFEEKLSHCKDIADSILEDEA